MRLLIVTDAWAPQVNGVVRTLTYMREGLRQKGWDVQVLGPEGTTWPCPTYPEIRLTLRPRRHILRALQDFNPDSIHIATEGPLGLAMRALCLEQGWDFTTSFHTRFPEYLKARFSMPLRWTYKFLRQFHCPARTVLAPTQSIVNELRAHGFKNVEVWGRGVDIELFSPTKRTTLPFLGPLLLYVGRLAVEKNVEEFLRLDLQGTKILVGDGPERLRLQRAYPEAVFMGTLTGEELARVYASADAFVFPSRTDTFGLVMLEALASGIPVAAYPTPGPLDVITNKRVGCLNENLLEAVQGTLCLSADDCRQFALGHSWQKSTERFAGCLVPLKKIIGPLTAGRRWDRRSNKIRANTCPTSN